MSSTAVELTTNQAWYLAEELRAGSFPWKLAITAPYYDPSERDDFNAQCHDELTSAGILSGDGIVHPVVAAAIRTVCRSRQWLEWLTMVNPDQVLRGVVARGTGFDAVVALRYAQMLALTPTQITCTEDLAPIITTGLPDQEPAAIDDFVIPMEVGAAIDKRVARGADIVEALLAHGVDERSAQAMEIARMGERVNVELTAHESTNGGRRDTEVSINILNTDVGRMLVLPIDDKPRAESSSMFTPAEPFTIAVAIRDLTARLPGGTWFPNESLTL